MFRLAICLFLIIGGAAMAAPKDVKTYDPFQQVPTPQGTMRDREDPPTDGEIALRMWQQYMGDKPMPLTLRRKYGLPDQDQSQNGQ
jgi:hypothetical protein